MKVNLIKEQTIRNYALKHAESRKSCEDFINKIQQEALNKYYRLKVQDSLASEVQWCFCRL